MDNGAATSDNLINFNSPAPTSNNNNNNRFRNSNNRKTSRPNSPTISTEVSLNEVREEVNNNLQNSKRTSRNSDRLAMINTEERVPIKDRGNPPPDDTVVKIQGVTLDIDDIPSIIDPKDTVDQEIKPASPNITISNANLGTSKSENIIPFNVDPETPNVKVDPAPVNSNRSLKPVPRTPRSYNSLNSPSSPVTGDKNPANTVNTANTPKISVQPPISINTNTRSKVANSRLLKPMISQPTPISTPAPAPAPPPPPANLPEEINLLSEDNNHRVPITNNLNNNNNNLIDSFFDDTTDKDSRNTNPPNPPNLEDKNVKSATATSTPTPPPPPTTPTAPINMPNYAAMTPTEKALQRATFRTRYGILRTAWPNYHIPDISDDKSLEEIHVEYDSYVRHIRISQDVDTYKIYLVIVWLVIELAITKTGLNIGGYTISQMRSMGKYERLLIELGETNYRAGSNSIFTQTTWPVEVRILVMALINAITFLVIKYLSSYIGEGMANTVVNGLASLMTGNPPQPGELLMGNITSPGPDAGGAGAPRVAPVPQTNPLAGIDFPDLLANLGSMFVRGQARSNANNANTNFQQNPVNTTAPTAGRFRPAYAE